MEGKKECGKGRKDDLRFTHLLGPDSIYSGQMEHLSYALW